MGDVVKLPKKDPREVLWEDYVEAARTAQKTLSLMDGLKAQAAWKKFIEAY